MAKKIVFNLSSKISIDALIFIVALVIATITYQASIAESKEEVLVKATHEANVVIALSSGYIRAYSEYEAKYAKGILPNPAIFRAHALALADLASLLDGSIMSEVVGFPGKSVNSKPLDDELKNRMYELQTSTTPRLLSSTYMNNGTTIHRSVWPFYATDNTCVHCHNAQLNLSGENRWKVGDLMGAQIVERNIQRELQRSEYRSYLIASLVFFIVLAVSYCFKFIWRQYYLTQELKTLATTDALTGCINRREMYTRITQQRNPISGAILMIDIDHFKKINDTYGHSAGDGVIRDLVAKIQSYIHKDDWVARVGGEEFLIWLEHKDFQTALEMAKKLRFMVEKSAFNYKHNQIFYTISIGIVTIDKKHANEFDDWISLADNRLYQAKDNGRNCIVSD